MELGGVEKGMGGVEGNDERGKRVSGRGKKSKMWRAGEDRVWCSFLYHKQKKFAYIKKKQ